MDAQAATVPPGLRPSGTATRVATGTLRPATRPGPEVSRLHVGDPDFATPRFIVEAMIEALNAGYTHYAQPQGDPDLRAALAEDLTGRSAMPYATKQVIITAGGSPAINAAVLATVDAGDRVVIPEPSYSLYGDAVRMAGGQPVFVPPGPDLHLDLERLERTVAGARMIILCHPCNPTGVVLRHDELEAVAAIADRHDLLVLSDEAYDHITYEAAFVSALRVEPLVRRLIYCQTFSKTFAMTGWRIGYVAAPAQIASAVGLINRTFNGAVNAAVQRGALAAVTTSTTWPAERRHDYRRRRDLVVAALARMPGIEVRPPEGTFYAFARHPMRLSSAEVVRRALDHRVGLRAGSEFGESGEGYIRVAFCVSDEDLKVGLDRLKCFFEAG